MSEKSRSDLKIIFENGKKPNEEEFAHLIDSFISRTEDEFTFVGGNVGINTSDPKAKLHIYDDGNDKVDPGISQATVMVGRQDQENLSLDNNEVQAKNGGAASILLLNQDGGDIRLFHGTGLDKAVMIKDTGRIGFGTVSPSGPIHVSQTGGDFIVKTDGNVGIGTDNPEAMLHVKFSADLVFDDAKGGAVIFGDKDNLNISFDNNEISAKNGAGTSTLYLNKVGSTVSLGGNLVYSSDKTLKKNIKPLKEGLREILKLKPVSYVWKSDKTNDTKYGFIAQDVEKILGEITYLNEKNKTKGIAYTEIIPVLTNAIQEQQKQIESLEVRLAKLEKLVK